MFNIGQIWQFSARPFSASASVAVFLLLVAYLTVGTTWLEILSTAFVASLMVMMLGLTRLYSALLANARDNLRPIPVTEARSEPAIVDDFWARELPVDDED